ncbi:LuxR family transcriptional regulator [Mesorhizobium australicum]|uniref:LuxR family transcriptional regulator n=1 Tax=Mesorhizobium australicum TaxID=536018 RepID=UPI00333A57F2
MADGTFPLFPRADNQSVQAVFFLPPIDILEVARDAFAGDFAQFVEQTNGVSKSEQLFGRLSDFALNFGFPWIAYGPPTTLDRKSLKPVRRVPPVMLNYPDDWQKRCSEMGYDRIDPIVKKLRKQTGAFRWSEMYNDEHTTEIERRVFDEAAIFGLGSGVSVPLHGPNGTFEIMSFASPGNHRLHDRTITYLHLAALHFRLKVAKFVNASGAYKAPELSPREKECILWVARGKTSWGAGAILGISENTVNYHMKNIMRKMEASTRMVAAIKAIEFGIIEL